MQQPRRYAIITLTKGALALGRKLGIRLKNAAPTAQIKLYVHARFELAAHTDAQSAVHEQHIKQAIPDLMADLFPAHDSLIAIMASGIVVRSIAPVLRSKASDPAVLVIDEAGDFVISLLSGHLGRANDDARQIAALLGAQAVITTASDVTHSLAVDTLAMQLDCAIDDLHAAKCVTAEIVNGSPVAVLNTYFNENSNENSSNKQNAFALTQGWPSHVQVLENAVFESSQLENAVFESSQLENSQLENSITGGDAAQPNENTKYLKYLAKFSALIVISEQAPPALHANQVWLIPRRIVAGVGCKRGKSASEILSAIKRALSALGIDPRALKSIASVDLKADEIGLIEAAQNLNVPLKIVTRAAIAELGNAYHGSAFVEQSIGVAGVCEPAALLISQGTLIYPKHASSGVTVALARAPAHFPP